MIIGGDFRHNIGYILVIFTLLYVAGVTAAWLLGCQISDTTKEGLMFCFGWLFAKASTVIDYIFGAAQQGEKTWEKQSPPSPPSA